jgi:hypothetical protein
VANKQSSSMTEQLAAQFANLTELVNSLAFKLESIESVIHTATHSLPVSLSSRPHSASLQDYYGGGHQPLPTSLLSPILATDAGSSHAVNDEPPETDYDVRRERKPTVSFLPWVLRLS